MTEGKRCNRIRLVDAHFEGTISARRERELWEHLPGCSQCTTRFERQDLLARVDPARKTAQERIAIGLGLSRGSRLGRPRTMTLTAVSVAITAALVCLAVWTWRAPDDSRFQARGGGDSAALLQIYHVDRGNRSRPVGSSIPRDAELAFAYENGAAKKYLLVFGVDRSRRVFWYHPGWINPQRTPGAVPIKLRRQYSVGFCNSMKC